MLELIFGLLFVVFMLVYWLSEGCTEGYTWANKKRRTNNSLIFGAMKKGKPDGKGVLDYHAWRLGENIGNVGCMLTAYTLGKWCDFGFYELVSVWLGSWMMGYFIYERALNYVCLGSAFASKGPRKMMHISIERSNKFDWGVFVIGCILVLLPYVI